MYMLKSVLFTDKIGKMWTCEENVDIKSKMATQKI